MFNLFKLLIIGISVYMLSGNVWAAILLAILSITTISVKRR